MTSNAKIPVLRQDDGELLGYIRNKGNSWTAETIFGYVLARAESEAAADAVVRSEGLLTLQGMWRYMDSDHEWYPCILKEVYENRVVVIRTNELGFQDSSHYKLVTIKNPSETNLLKA